MEFLLYISGSTIHRYLFGSRSDMVLPLADVHDAISVEYDYHKNCVYWGDSSESVIRVGKSVFFVGKSVIRLGVNYVELTQSIFLAMAVECCRGKRR